MGVAHFCPTNELRRRRISSVETEEDSKQQDKSSSETSPVWITKKVLHQKQKISCRKKTK